MDTLLPLGTGAARAIHYYNTCFLLNGPQGRLLVDAGGGNGILRQLDRAGVGLQEITDLFVSHEHIDHSLGVIWLVRFSAQLFLKGKRPLPLRIHCHAELARKLQTICELTLAPSHLSPLGSHITFCPVHDGEQREIAGHTVTFLDTHSTKAEQHGFLMESPEGQRIVFTGDEPCKPEVRNRISGVDWLFHEAFCLDEHDDIFHPRSIGHDTVKSASQLAESCAVKNLVLWHTEDSETVGIRKERYMEEARRYFSGNVYIPDDLELISLTTH